MQSEAYEGVERQARALVHWVQLAVELAGAAVIAIGIVLALWWFAKSLARPSGRGFVRVRLVLAHYLALALEFLLAADILRTAVAPTWTEIGQLAAIAAIRTGLNFFLQREIAQERKMVEASSELKVES